MLLQPVKVNFLGPKASRERVQGKRNYISQAFIIKQEQA